MGRASHSLEKETFPLFFFFFNTLMVVAILLKLSQVFKLLFISSSLCYLMLDFAFSFIFYVIWCFFIFPLRIYHFEV